jgi:hypothetical protein
MFENFVQLFEFDITTTVDNPAPLVESNRSIEKEMGGVFSTVWGKGKKSFPVSGFGLSMELEIDVGIKKEEGVAKGNSRINKSAIKIVIYDRIE